MRRKPRRSYSRIAACWWMPVPRPSSVTNALRFAVLAAEKLDPAATRRRAVNPQHEERHAFLEQSLHAEPMPALRRVERLQMGLQFVDQKQGVRGIGALSGDGGRHEVILPHSDARKRGRELE